MAPQWTCRKLRSRRRSSCPDVEEAPLFEVYDSSNRSLFVPRQEYTVPRLHFGDEDEIKYICD